MLFAYDSAVRAKLCASLFASIFLLSSCGGGGDSDSDSLGGASPLGIGATSGLNDPATPFLTFNNGSRRWSQQIQLNGTTAGVPFTENTFIATGNVAGPVGTTLQMDNQLGASAIDCGSWTTSVETQVTGTQRTICTRGINDPVSSLVIMRQIQRWYRQEYPAMRGFLNRQQFIIDFRDILPEIIESNRSDAAAGTIPVPIF